MGRWDELLATSEMQNAMTLAVGTVAYARSLKWNLCREIAELDAPTFDLGNRSSGKRDYGV